MVLLLTLQQLGVYEQLQRQQQHHHHHAGHQDAVEAGRQQAHLPQRRPAAAARLQPVGPEQRAGGQAGVSSICHQIVLIRILYNILQQGGTIEPLTYELELVKSFGTP